jgi:hypothetical protein
VCRRSSNGSAMRAGPVGLAYFDDLDKVMSHDSEG